MQCGVAPAYVACHPGLARQVLTDMRGFDRTGLVYEQVRTAMGNSLVGAAGPRQSRCNEVVRIIRRLASRHHLK